MPDRDHARGLRVSPELFGVYPRDVTRRKPTDPMGLERAASLVRDTQSRVHETALKRGSPQGVERWHAAVQSWHQAMELLYPSSFLDDVEQLKQGDPAA